MWIAMLNQKNSFTHCNSQMQKLLLNAEQPNQNLSRNIRKSIADDIQDMKDFGSVIVQKKNFAILMGKLKKHFKNTMISWRVNGIAMNFM